MNRAGMLVVRPTSCPEGKAAAAEGEGAYSLVRNRAFGRGQRGHRGRSSVAGITLVEMMVVIAIIGLVMGAVVVAAFPALARARCKTAYGETQTIQQAIGMYRSENASECPKALGDLVTGHYISKEPVDPWGKPFTYKCPGEKNVDTGDVASAGPDKQEGTQDDVKGWMRLEEQCK